MENQPQQPVLTQEVRYMSILFYNIVTTTIIIVIIIVY